MLLSYVRKVKGFYIHLIQYVLVIGVLALLNFVITPTKLWFLWAAFGWGVGIMAHALAVFELVPFFGPEWEKRQVEKRLGRLL